MDPFKSNQSSKNVVNQNVSKYSTNPTSSRKRKLQFWECHCWKNSLERSRWITIGYLLFAILIFLSIRYIVETYIATSPSLPSSSASNESPNRLDHYAIVIDAGSSGSRAYLYAWPSHSGDMHELLKIRPLVSKTKTDDGELEAPLVEKVTPGLSSLSDTPEMVMDYIRPLFVFASKHIPEKYHKETSLYILATAGMRLLSKHEQDGILSSLRNGINSEYPFLFPEDNLEIISGSQEGIYQWLAINYVLGKLDHHVQAPNLSSIKPKDIDKQDILMSRPKTVGAIDMGGASMQIAMEIPQSENIDDISEPTKSQITEINIGCRGDYETRHKYRLFVTTFLGYGANEALARHQRSLLISQIQKRLSGDSNEVLGLSIDKRSNDPCLPLGMKKDVSATIEFDKLSSENMKSFLKDNLTISSEDVKLFTIGTGLWDECFNTIKDFAKESEPYIKECNHAENGQSNCADNGIHLPPVLRLENKEFYGFSEFWYTMEDVLGLGGVYHQDVFEEASENFCKTNWDITWNKFKDDKFPKADKERIETQCFKSAWIAVALKEGFLFPSEYSGLTSAPNTVNGRVAHWTVGALLYRTRYFPLRYIEAKAKSQIPHGSYHSSWESGYLYSRYIVFLCLGLTLAAILLYLRRIKRCARQTSYVNEPYKIGNLLPASSRLDTRNSSNSKETYNGRYPLISV